MKTRLPLIAWAALPLTLGLAFAAQGTQSTRTQSTQPQPTQSGQTLNQPGIPQNQTQSQPGQAAPRSGTNYADVFLQKLAAQLGVSVDRLKAAATAAGSATIDQGVQAGDFSSDRAAEMKQRLNDNPFAFGGRGPGGRGGHGMHGRGGDMERGPRGKGDHRHDQGTLQDDTNAQGAAQDSSFTF